MNPRGPPEPDAVVPLSPYGPHGRPDVARDDDPRRTPRPALVETLVYGTALAVLLAALLARSPLWDHLPDAAAILPERYVAVLGVLPVSTNTALAFLVALGAVLVVLFVTEHPVVGLSVVSASALGVAAYPYGRILWHRVFLGELERSTPGAADWILGLIVVGMLLVHPIMLQIRTILARYGEKGVAPAALGPVRRHLVETALMRAAGALGFALVMGVLLAILPGGTPDRFFLDNSIVVLLVAGALVIAAVGLGTGLFSTTPRPATEQAPSAPDPDATRTADEEPTSE